MIETVNILLSLLILAWFIGFCFYLWDNIRECCQDALADEIGAGRKSQQHLPSPLGERLTATAMRTGADEPRVTR